MSENNEVETCAEILETVKDLLEVSKNFFGKDFIKVESKEVKGINDDLCKKLI